MKTPELSHVWDRHPDDWYVEPEWCSERLFAVHKFAGSIVDPSCGLGRIVKAAARAGYNADGWDIVRRTSDIPVRIIDIVNDEGLNRVDNIVSNPPFMYCNDASGFVYVKRALALARRQVALLLPAKWQHGDKRGKWLQTTPLEFVYAITPRPSMPPGTVIEAGVDPGGGKQDFSWYVWRHGYEGEPRLRWLSKYETNS